MNGLDLKEIKFLQQSAGAKPDGKPGPKTLRAIRSKTGYRGNDSKVLVHYAQTLINAKRRVKITEDGIMGPVTDSLLRKLMGRSTARPSIVINRKVQKEFVHRPNLRNIIGVNPPRQGTANLKRFYGKPGADGLVTLTFPCKMYYNNKRVRTTRVHPKALPAFEYLFENALAHYGQSQMDALGLTNYGGCYNFRKMRGGRSYSTHSWGIAMDLNAGNNRLRMGREKASMSSSIYQKFWDIAYAAGFISLGIEHDYDWMHLQLTR